MLQELMDVRIAELAIAERQINQRMEFAQLSRIDRLESALRSARGRLSLFGYSTPIKA
jgi:hypothetical protein